MRTIKKHNNYVLIFLILNQSRFCNIVHGIRARDRYSHLLI